MKYYVVVTDCATGEITEKVGPMPTLREAWRAEIRAERDFNDDDYATRVLNEDEMRGLEKTNEGEDE
ncbi:MAG: hypothetical protein KDK05_28965 [Candidatus Competibacteraceae bacterium]|nr:hypothetical protein [Candidatus Competibacteraceae bacterium]